MELAKRLGKRAAGEEVDEGEQRRRKIEQDLYAIPDHLQVEGEAEGAGGASRMGRRGRGEEAQREGPMHHT